MTRPQEAWDRIAPFALREIGDLIGMLGGTGEINPNSQYILLLDASALIIEQYAPTEQGLRAALGASATGDIVLLPSGTLALTTAITIAAGVTLRGRGRDSTVLAGTGSAVVKLVTCNGTIENLSITFANDYSGGEASTYALWSNLGEIHRVRVSMTISTNKTAYAGYVNNVLEGRSMTECSFSVEGDGNANTIYGLYLNVNHSPGVLSSVENVDAYANDSTATSYGVYLRFNSGGPAFVSGLKGYAYPQRSTATGYGIYIYYNGGDSLHINGMVGKLYSEGGAGAGIHITTDSYPVLTSCIGLVVGTGTVSAPGIELGNSYVFGSYGTGRNYGINCAAGATSYLYDSVGTGATADINVAATGTLNVFSAQYDTLVNAGTFTYLPGDRLATTTGIGNSCLTWMGIN